MRHLRNALECTGAARTTIGMYGRRQGWPLQAARHGLGAKRLVKT